MHSLYPLSSCPDCDANVRAVQVSPLVYVLQIEHDDTCPTFRGVIE